jgi:hypothetical protein
MAKKDDPGPAAQGAAQADPQPPQENGPAGADGTQAAPAGPVLGATVYFTHPSGQEVNAAIIGRVREHGGCDLFVLAPGGAYWERNIHQGDGPDCWRYPTRREVMAAHG